MGWADSFFRGVDSEVGRRRQSRMDALAAEAQRSELALREAAGRREEERMRMQQEQQAQAQERATYLDRTRQLNRETAPFQKLLGTYPEADASAYTGRAYELDETIARDPLAAARSVPDPASDAAREAGYTPMGPEAPTLGQDRQSAIQEAYRRFGGAASARTEAMAELRRQLGRMRGAAGQKPYSKDLEQEQRALDRMSSDIAKMEQGLIQGPDGQWQAINLIRDPDIADRHAAALKALKATYATRRASLDQAYQERLGIGTATAGFDPTAYYQLQISQGVPEEAVLAELQAMGHEIEP